MSSKYILCNTYKVLKPLGEGGFSKVYKCITLDTKEIVAVKVIPKKFGWYAENELNALMRLRSHGQHENLVSLNRHFITKESYILEFEMLDMTLDDLIIKTGRPLYLNEIQEITQQIVMALKTLSNLHLVHLDIKPDNIMLVNHKRWPFKVKLIDFGLAFSVDKLTTGYKMQTIDYRAPEVILGLPLNEAVDMWSLGCIVAFMFFGEDFYSASCEFDRIREMVRLQGQPEDKLLNSGIYSTNFFFLNVKSVSWELLEECDCHVDGHSTTHNVLPSLLFKSIDEIMKDHPNTTENEDMTAFVNLFKQMMEVDPEKRISPDNALWHSFFKRKHFPRDCDMTQQGAFNRETCITTNEKCRLEEPAVKYKLKSPIHMKEAANTNLDDSDSVQEETATCTSKERRLTKPPVKPKSRATYTIRSEGASSTKFDDALSDHNLDDSHSVQEETATCTSKERRLTKPPVKPKSRATYTIRSEGASSTKFEDSLADHKGTAAYINAECNLQKAPEKPKRKGKSRIHMKEASNTNLDDSHSVQEETATCTSKERRLTKPPVKPKSRATFTIRSEGASSTKFEDSLADHKGTAAYINAECNLQKAPEKPKRKGKSRIHMKEATNTKFNKSHADHKETTADIKAVFSLKKAPEKSKHKGKSRIHMKEATKIEFNKSHSVQEETSTCTSKESTLKKPKRKAKSTMRSEGASSTPSPIVVAFKKIRRFLKSLVMCCKS